MKTAGLPLALSRGLRAILGSKGRKGMLELKATLANRALKAFKESLASKARKGIKAKTALACPSLGPTLAQKSWKQAIQAGALTNHIWLAKLYMYGLKAKTAGLLQERSKGLKATLGLRAFKVSLGLRARKAPKVSEEKTALAFLSLVLLIPQKSLRQAIQAEA